MELKKEKCVPCEMGGEPLKKYEILDMVKLVDSRWSIEGGKAIRRVFKFRNFKEALKFVNIIGEIAEEEGHHPDIELGWGKVSVKFTTHKIGGLSTNDFIMAAKIDEVAV
ncbi:4a-hydroxytetrahydrobiopterin dehydratase [uncultured Ilyobacter sp.]|uniref:4a-hydroxytetrahydrobiopterin dehydratase n=1 Tax=uncultured Ilyobacter sp. TaxID=544433 RepID=UPI0029F46345|nr:4a-hydroxytetrahydrobiopterin dehydratase [uncultured Ilyobacter sp.]